MILYDLLHKDPTEVQPKQEEEEIDITQEAQQFKPVEVSKEMPNIQKPATAEEQPKAETPEKADSSKAETPKEEKPAAPDNTHETPEKDDSPRPDSPPTQEPPSKPQPAPSQPAQEPKADAKKEGQKALSKYRNEVGSISRRERSIKITDREWEAIQAGAISENKLKSILNSADIDKLRERATPRSYNSLSTAQIGRAKAMASSNYTIEQIAKKLGVSKSTVSKYLK